MFLQEVERTSEGPGANRSACEEKCLRKNWVRALELVSELKFAFLCLFVISEFCILS